ncbi:hypothetical protein Trydic_g14802 [Trypoxylus dichotomus]
MEKRNHKNPSFVISSKNLRKLLQLSRRSDRIGRNQQKTTPPSYLHLDSYDSTGITAGRATHARQIEGEEPDQEIYRRSKFGVHGKVPINEWAQTMTEETVCRFCQAEEETESPRTV